MGSFPNWDVWAEWNGKYRDDMRRFIKGDPGMKPALATRLAGSADLYQVIIQCVIYHVRRWKRAVWFRRCCTTGDPGATC